MSLTRKDEDPEDCSANLQNITWFRELPWRWLDNSIYDYKKEPTWAKNKPNSYSLCGMYWVSAKQWHSGKCDYPQYCLCQKSKITKDDQTHSSASETTTDGLTQSITTESLDMLSQTTTEKTEGDQNTVQNVTSGKHMVQ